MFAAEDPVFGGGACRVASCRRAARSHGMCQGHHLRWVGEGRPDLDVFAATTDPRWRRQRPNARCRVTGCGYGTARGGMCQLHGQRWDRAGRPDLRGWLADPPTIKTPPPGAVCAVEHCDLWPQAALPFCHAHANTWKVNGRPDDRRVRPRLRRGHGHRRARSSRWTCSARSCVWRSSTSCSAATTSGPPRPCPRWSWRWCGRWPPPAWRRCWTGPRTTGGPGSARPAPRRLQRAARICCSTPAARTVCRRRRLGGASSTATSGSCAASGSPATSGSTSPHPAAVAAGPGQAVAALAARAAGLGLEAARRGLRALTRFALFCQPIGVTALADVDRAVLERYLADLHAELAGRQRHGDQIGQLNSFLHAIRQHHWDDTLPAQRAVLPRGLPRARRAAAARAGRAGHGPDRAPRQPRPVRQPRLPAGHPDPDPLRAAGHRRAAAWRWTAWSSTPTAPPTCATSTTR